MKHNRTSEADISKAVLTILKNCPNGEATLSEIRKQIPHTVNLTPEDRVPSPTRKNEELWEQILRNIVSHKMTLGNLIADGLVIKPRKGVLRIV